MKYNCPVCGYNQLSQPPERDMICPCCGTQFDYHDYAFTHDELRNTWILSKGARWHSKRTLAPQGWDAFTQIVNAGIPLLMEEEKALRKDQLELAEAGV